MKAAFALRYDFLFNLQICNLIHILFPSTANNTRRSYNINMLNLCLFEFGVC